MYPNKQIAKNALACMFLLNGLYAAFLVSPCPKTFSYILEDNLLTGLIRGPNLRNVSTTYTVRIEIGITDSIRNASGLIEELPDFKGFKVHFPDWLDTPPKLLKIVLNGSVVCEDNNRYNENGKDWSRIDLNHTLDTNGYDSRIAGTPSRHDFPEIEVPEEDSACGSVTKVRMRTQLVVDIYPWVVSIFKTVLRVEKFICGGSLFTERHVISAAHCFDSNDAVDLYGFKMNSTKNLYAEGFMMKATRIFMNPHYFKMSAAGDLAIVVLQRTVHVNRFVRPVCLWKGALDIASMDSKIGSFVGWVTSPHSKAGILPVAKETHLPIVTNQKCNLPVLTEGGHSFCAGYEENGKWYGACKGDSGSGFFLKKGNRFYLRGIISIGYMSNVDECDLKTFTVMTDITAFSIWINNTATKTSLL